jgi:glycosyltransferase involved in cell wall biosynthesis
LKVYFYPHRYLRDRHLTTIRNWPSAEVCNPDLAQNRVGAQVTVENKKKLLPLRSWMKLLPLVNLKWRPSDMPPDAVAYIWGGLAVSGKYITELDNPWSLVGYNVRAMPIYRTIISKMLLEERCLSIRCISEACRESLLLLFGERVYDKSTLVYPKITKTVSQTSPTLISSKCRFLFIGTQFELKGGPALLRAFRRLVDNAPDAELTVITHLPTKYQQLVDEIPNLKVVAANLTSEQIRVEYLSHADVLVHPSYMESFGMVLLEALSCSLAIICTDMYASGEMVQDKKNGFLLKPPISAWENGLPTSNFLVPNLMRNLDKINFSEYEDSLFNKMNFLVENKNVLDEMKRESMNLYVSKFL